ncbi:MAG: DUF3626 domain-containing protein [Phascolarctobacterium sp.]|nr:DUF3626 domain-containing protein [Phascolarctobacterium sp.]
MELLKLLAKAFDTKGYPDDRDPSHWKTIQHSPVHIDENGNIDGGAGGKFHGAKWSSARHPHKATPESYGKKKEPAKTVEDLKAAWKKVAKERMEVRRAKTERSRAAHTDKLEAAFKEYTDMRASMYPAEAAKFKPTTGGISMPTKTPKSISSESAASPLIGLAESTKPKESDETLRSVKGYRTWAESAMRIYAEYKKTGTRSQLETAQELLEEALAFLDASRVDASSAALADANKELLYICKKKGLNPTSIEALIQEIQAAEYKMPGKEVSSPMEMLAEATAGRGASGATYDEVAKGRSKVPSLIRYEDQRDRVSKLTYDAMGFTGEERQQFEKDLKRIFANSAYGMSISTESLHKVLNSEFKSQYETHTSGGAEGKYALEKRAKIFGRLLGSGKTDVDDFPKKTREKYGAIISKDINDDRGARWYGECLVRFKKEHLAGRVTYTFGDSLGCPMDYSIRDRAAGDADSPSIAGLIENPDWAASKKVWLTEVSKCKDVADLYEKFMADYDWDLAYIEAQYHGHVGAEDIESVTIRSETVDERLVRRLKTRGIKVYQSIRDSRGKTTVREI